MAVSAKEAEQQFMDANQLRFQYEDETDPNKTPFTQYLAPVYKLYLDKTTRTQESTGKPASVHSTSLHLGSYQNVRLKDMPLQAWESLKPPDPSADVDKGWLFESAIFNLVNLSSEAHNPSTLFFSPEILSQVLDEGAATRRQKMYAMWQDIENTGWVNDAFYNAYVPETIPTGTTKIVLLLWANMHFSCASIDLVRKSVTSFNSWSTAHGHKSQKPQDVLECFTRLLDLKETCAPDGPDWSFVDDGACLKQENAYDCGVLAIDNVNHLMRGEEPRKAINQTVKDFCILQRAHHLEKLFVQLQTALPGNGPDVTTVTTRAGGTAEPARAGSHYEADEAERKYCYCNEVEYGDMVACDKEGCPQEWFHLPCTELTEVPSEDQEWYCIDCRDPTTVSGTLQTFAAAEVDAMSPETLEELMLKSQAFADTLKPYSAHLQVLQSWKDGDTMKASMKTTGKTYPTIWRNRKELRDMFRASVTGNTLTRKDAIDRMLKSSAFPDTLEPSLRQAFQSLKDGETHSAFEKRLGKPIGTGYSSRMRAKVLEQYRAWSAQFCRPCRLLEQGQCDYDGTQPCTRCQRSTGGANHHADLCHPTNIPSATALDVLMRTDDDTLAAVSSDGFFFAATLDAVAQDILAQTPANQDTMRAYKRWYVDQKAGLYDVTNQDVMSDGRFLGTLTDRMRALIRSGAYSSAHDNQASTGRTTVEYLYRAWVASDEESRLRYIADPSTIGPLDRRPKDQAPRRRAQRPVHMHQGTEVPTDGVPGAQLLPQDQTFALGTRPQEELAPGAPARKKRRTHPPVRLQPGVTLPTDSLLGHGQTETPAMRQFVKDVETGLLKSVQPLRHVPGEVFPWRLAIHKSTATWAGATYVDVRTTSAVRNLYQGSLRRIHIPSSNAACLAWMINRVLGDWTDVGEEADILDVWLSFHTSSCRIRSLNLSFQDTLASQHTSKPGTALRACFVCLSPVPLQRMTTLDDGRKVCWAHRDVSSHTSTRISLSTFIPVATVPISDIVYDDTDAKPLGRNGNIIRTIKASTLAEGREGSSVVSQGKLYAFARSFFTQPQSGIWLDPWSGETRDSNAAKYAADELHDTYEKAGHPFAPSVDCLDPIMLLDGKRLMHALGNITVMLLAINYMKNMWSRQVVPLMGMAARQTFAERVKRTRGEVDWHDTLFWSWWENAMAHVHFISTTYAYRRAARFQMPMPSHDAQALFATSLKTGRYSPGHGRVVMRTRSSGLDSPWAKLFPQIQHDWFTPRFIALTDEIEEVTGVLVPRWGDTRLPWTFIENHQIPGEQDPAGWWKRFMLGYFRTATHDCDKKNYTALVKKESPLTFGLLFVVDFCEKGGYDDFIYCRMSPFAKSPLCASNARLTTVAPATEFATGFTDPWPTSFRNQYISSNRTVGPQPLIVNRLWYDFPRSKHSAIFNELRKLKEESEYCPAPAKDLEFLDYQNLVRVQKARGAQRLEDDDDEDSAADVDDDEDAAAVLHDDGQQHMPDDEDMDDYGSGEFDEAGRRDIDSRTRYERMQQEWINTESVFQEDGLMQDPIVVECFAFMQQSMQDDDELSFEMMVSRLVEYSEDGRAPPLQDGLMHGVELLEVGIRNMAQELGGLAAIGLNTQASGEVSEMKAAVHVRSFKQYYLRKAELESLLEVGAAELRSRANANRIALLVLEHGANEKTMRSFTSQVEALTSQLEALTSQLEGLRARNSEIDEELAMLRG